MTNDPIKLHITPQSPELTYINKDGVKFDFPDHIKSIEDICEAYISLHAKLEVAVIALEHFTHAEVLPDSLLAAHARETLAKIKGDSND